MDKNKITLTATDALIIVDVQNDFLPNGSLAVANGNQVVNPLNHYIDLFNSKGFNIIATRDWHPANHVSFKAQGGNWPPHCVANSSGANFSRELALPQSAIIISKATETHKDAYSGFENTELDSLLKNKMLERLFIGGLATDYCVLNTVLDALRLNYEVFLLVDAIQAVNLAANDGEQAIQDMLKAGAQTLKLDDINK